MPRRRILRAAAIGATVAAAATITGRTGAAADEPEDTGQVTLGALLVSYASAPLAARGNVTWTVTKQRTDTIRMSSTVLVGSSFKVDQTVTGQFGTVGTGGSLAQAASSQVTNGLAVKSTSSWSITTFAERADGINTVRDTTFFLVLQPVMNITGNPTKGFRFKFLDSGIKSARRVSELQDPGFRASIGAATADAILAQYPLLQNVSGRALGLTTPRYKFKDQINPAAAQLAFDRSVARGSTFSEQKTARVTVMIIRSQGFTIGPIMTAFMAGQTLEVTSTSVQEIETTTIIGTKGQLTSDQDHVNFLYMDRVFKTILITDEGPRSAFRQVISGTVTDQFGSPVPGALVSLVDSEGYRTAQADSSGAYTIVRPTQLAPGTYTVVCGGIQQPVSVGPSGTGTSNYRGVDPTSARQPALPVLE